MSHISTRKLKHIITNPEYHSTINAFCLDIKVADISEENPEAYYPLRSRGALYFLLTLISVILFQCSPKTGTTSLPLDSLKHFSDSGQQAMPERWWTAFGDSKLNILVDSALNSNFNLIGAWYQLQAAEAVVDRESSFLLPDIEASLRGAINRPQPDFVGGENLQLGLSAGYEVDLWGRIRANINAEKYRKEATYADYQAAAISLSAEITRTWFQLVAAQSQLELIQQQVATNEDIVKLIKARFGGGQTRGVDILRQMQLLEATREQMIMAESTVQVLEHRLAVLLGRQPQQEFIYQTDSLPDLPPIPETGIPVDLVERRPDVKGAYLQLLAADRDLAAAISNQYPRLSFSSSVQMRANSAETLFQDWAYSLGGNLLAPIFYGGRLSAEVDRNEAFKNQLLYQYGQSVLVAFQEVEDALIQEEKQRERIEVIKEQLSLAIKTNQQLRIEYLNGMSGYLDVLTALDQEQQLRRSLITEKMNLLEFRIALYRALAGGFETEREEENDS